MTDIQVQFHADPIELIDLVSTWWLNGSVHMTAIQLRPFKASEVLDLVELTAKWPVSMLAVTTWHPHVHVDSWSGFLKQNPGALVLEVGPLCTDGLRESSLSSRCSDEAVAQVWKRFAGQLRKITHGGVWVSTEDGQHRRFYRNHRYTEGARQLQSRGIRILPSAGNAHIHLGEL